VLTSLISWNDCPTAKKTEEVARDYSMPASVLLPQVGNIPKQLRLGRRRKLGAATEVHSFLPRQSRHSKQFAGEMTLPRLCPAHVGQLRLA
jgi:hypothetical protein